MAAFASQTVWVVKFDYACKAACSKPDNNWITTYTARESRFNAEIHMPAYYAGTTIARLGLFGPNGLTDFEWSVSSDLDEQRSSLTAHCAI